MKRVLFFVTLCMVAVCASASNKYVKTDGSDGLDGKSWANAFATVQKAINNCPSGDTVFIAEGVYNETFSIGNGVTLLGGYDPTTGDRDIELYETVLDGTEKGKYILVIYSTPTDRVTIDGITFQNAIHTQWGGGALYLRDNMTVNNCKVINCQGKTAGGIFLDHADGITDQTIISNCLVELCNCPGGSAAAIYNNNGIVENCIVRGCDGSAAAIRNETGASIVRNTVIYNNSLTGTWPNSSIYNKGKIYNCTFCNNYGDQYPGLHSNGDEFDATVYNCVIWGNKNQEGFSDPTTFIEGGSSSHNVADQGFGSSSAFLSKTLNADNTAADGPNFRNPTTFVGAPTNDVEIAQMRDADFSITAVSTPLLNVGKAGVVDKDINGVSRPKQTGIDIGAYEYDPDAVQIAVTGVSIKQDTIKVIKGKSGTLVAIVTPSNANNKRVDWSIDDPTVASIKNGAVTGLKEDTTIARATTQDGGFTASAVVVILPVPPTFYPKEVLAADAAYQIEDYTIPSFIPFLVAKEAARIDSLEGRDNPDIALIDSRLAAMNDAIGKLVPNTEPYNMIANINGDPATHMAFCWFTNEGVTEGKVQLLAKAGATASDFEAGTGVINVNATPTTTPALNYFVSTSNMAEATKLSINTKFKYVSHKAIADNLTPGTTYSWRVGYDGHWSNIATFTTKATEQGDFSFIYMSDSHIQDAEYVDAARQCATAAAKNETDVKFCVFPGDFVETGTLANSEWEWERWFEESINPVIMNMPVVVTDGNHDDSENLNYDYHFNTDWGFYDMASTKPQFHGITYSFVYGDVLFLVFSLQDYWRAHGTNKETYVCSYLSTDVRNWFLEQVAKYPNTKYRVTLAHKNIFSGSGHSTDSETPLFREIMLPIFKECQIDLAIQGHDHCYEVIGPVNPDTRTAITTAISGVQSVAVNTNTNMTGKKGGTFTTDEGTLYFIGATCGAKRYYPYNRSKMNSNIEKHKVTNYFDLFTSMFGQPEAPSYSRFNVTSEGIEIKSYKTDAGGNSTEYNTINIKRTTPHTTPTGYEDVSEQIIRDGEKFIRDGQLFILKDGRTFNALGQEVE